MMVAAGLKPMQAIVAATRGSAQMLGAADRGTLEKGKRADFLVLAGNPLDDHLHHRSATGKFGPPGQPIPDSWAPVR